MSINILDIDLDFFADRRIDEGTYIQGERPSSDLSAPWPLNKVVVFLENNIGLTKCNKLKGKVFSTHEEVFLYINNFLHEPVNLIHLDAHSDIYASNWVWITNKYLDMPVSERRKQYQGYLNETNFIVFLKACGYLDSLTYISKKEWLNDIIPGYHPNCSSIYYNIFQIPHLRDDDIFAQGGRGLEDLVKNGAFTWEDEPLEVRLIDRDVCHLSDTYFDLAFLTHSPDYTPVELDAVIPVFKEYICDI